MENKKEVEVDICPDGNDPKYCKFCQMAMEKNTKEEEKRSRKTHGV